ncbi:hypothetical protein [Hyphomicrobium sp.]|uniref:phage late control D family protein n=1 Tax=Hyphomicrobium sp. TaxID=82 RepID=UPI001E0E8E99|nr:hypothetical protein [Hyphomicrobium sp.]MBY0559881.1 hypothetical protein [Hyphomicrobium sp.]
MKPTPIVSGLTAGANDRLISVEVTDHEGTHSDTATIVLDDRDGILALPQKGQVFTVSLGYRETGVELMGEYTVNDVTLEGYPQKIKVQGKSADMGKSKLKEPRSKHHEKKTIGQIVGEAAARAGVVPMVGPELGNFVYNSLHQTDESDMSLLSRLAHDHDATFTVKNGRMIFMPKEGGFSVTGLAMGAAFIRGPGSFIGVLPAANIPGDVIKYDCTLPDRPKHSQIKVGWWDTAKAKLMVEQAQSGSDGPTFFDRHHAPNQKEAQARAKGRGKRMKREQGHLRVEVVGDPSLRAEMLAIVTGIRAGVDGPWRVKSATHHVEEKGYTCSLDCELPGSGAASQ